MSPKQIDQLIINSPYEEPREHWRYNPDTGEHECLPGRRPAGYVVASGRSPDDPGRFVEIPLVNQIRERLEEWRENGRQGVTGVTRRLLEHWWDPEAREVRRLFFCQLEAIETLIWLREVPGAGQGLSILGDGGPFERLCSKMATGSGKTVVMAMLIAWQVLNKVTYPQDPRFARSVFVVAPGLTVRNRLRVLYPSDPENYYDAFALLPSHEDKQKLLKATILVRNWQALSWETAEQLAKKRTVDKRGPKSNAAYARGVLGPDLARARNLLVINDEAHHAWRVPAESKVRGIRKEDIDQATVWVSGLDRIHAANGILSSHDFSATPFAPSGKEATGEALYSWIVSDFGLNDAIESGLVKTPRIVVRDDGSLGPDMKSRLYHIYMDSEVKDDLNRRAPPETPLPDLVANAYSLLGADWLEKAKLWAKTGETRPPVMITVANRTEAAARIKYAFDRKKIAVPQLGDPDYTLHIDSKVLEMAEAQEEPAQADEPADDEERPAHKKTKAELAEELRRKVDTVGVAGQPGEKVQNVISVGMLSEGWDAKTVTHIMGLRAFSSQLLCEQVVGRGLRRASYEVDPETGLYAPEYVNIFGIPFSFLPQEGRPDEAPPSTRTLVEIKPLPARSEFELSWPNIVRINHTFRPALHLDLDKVDPLELDAYGVRLLAELAPLVDGAPDLARIATIDLQKLAREQREQRLVFQAACDVYDQMKPSWPGNREYLLAQLIRIVERVMASDRIQVVPPLFAAESLRRRLVITLSLNKVVQHIWQAIRAENTETLEPIFDPDRTIRTTGDMSPWWTGRPTGVAMRSHINRCVYDGTWETSEAWELDRNPHVQAWAKNDHLGFEILYIEGGVVRRYRPDFLIRLSTGKMLVLETKGQDTPRDRTKRTFLDEWARAVNQHRGFGHWSWAVSFTPADLAALIARAQVV